MEFILNDIERALDAKLYFIALQSSLTLPDMCAALISPNGETSRKKYISWYDAYAKEPSPLAISGSDCYYFRCSCVHQGSTMQKNSNYSRILFIVPNPIISGHNNVINDSLQIDVNIFCKNMIAAVRKWIPQAKDNPIYIANHKKVLQLYPNGLSPYIGGIPVIA